MSGLFEYHQRSKHRINHYAPGPTGLDWANQPNPFREFDRAAKLELPLAGDSVATRYNELRGGSLPPPSRFDLDHLAILFELSLGLSAWKAYGAQRWALRCNPSSGNLHPTEGYLLCPHLTGLQVLYLEAEAAGVRSTRMQEALDLWLIAQDPSRLAGMTPLPREVFAA
jgi:hypothetical protein